MQVVLHSLRLPEHHAQQCLQAAQAIFEPQQLAGASLGCSPSLLTQAREECPAGYQPALILLAG